MKPTPDTVSLAHAPAAARLIQNVRAKEGKRMRFVLPIVVALALSVPALAEEKVSGIYSGLRYNNEGGDLLGMEVMIFPSRSGTGLHYSALIQMAEGGAPDAALVPIQEKNGKVEFVVPAANGAPELRFTGVITKNELVVRWANGTEEHLKRGKSYWE